MSAIATIPVTRTSLPNRIVIGELDSTLRYAMDRVPQTWFQDVACHGNERGRPLALVGDDYIEISIDQLAAIIRAQPGFGSRPIRLLMCWAGLNLDATAQKLASCIGLPVLAAPCEIDTDGFAPIGAGARFQLFWPE